jgi:hypothetical protein
MPADITSAGFFRPGFFATAGEMLRDDDLSSGCNNTDA